MAGQADSLILSVAVQSVTFHNEVLKDVLLDRRCYSLLLNHPAKCQLHVLLRSFCPDWLFWKGLLVEEAADRTA